MTGKMHTPCAKPNILEVHERGCWACCVGEGVVRPTSVLDEDMNGLD